MPDQTTTVSDDAEIEGGDDRSIAFPLLAPDPIILNAIPTHSETGLLGEIAL